MTGGPPAGLPDGRTLSRWRDRLAALAPRSLWVGTLDLAHLEVPIRVSRPMPLDALHRHLLAAIAATPGATATDLNARLHLGPALGRWLEDLCAVNLLRIDSGRCVVTPRAERALTAGNYPHPTTERRRFTFVLPGPHYLPWAAPSGPHHPALDGAEVRWVVERVARPADWKRRTGFPEDVEAVELPAPGLPPAAAWRRVAVTRSERVPVVLAVAGVGMVAGFVPDAGGGLNAAAPALRPAAGTLDALPELAEEPDASSAQDVGEGWRLVGTGRLRRAVHP